MTDDKKQPRDFHTERNIRLSNLLNGINLASPYRLINVKSPQILMAEAYIVSARWDQFKLILFDQFKDGNEIFTIDLKRQTKYYSQTELDDFEYWLDKAGRKEIFRIKFDMVDLYLIDFSKSYVSGKVVNYPIFAPVNAKIYYEKEYVDGVKDNLLKNGFDVTVI